MVGLFSLNSLPDALTETFSDYKLTVAGVM